MELRDAYEQHDAGEERAAAAMEVLGTRLKLTELKLLKKLLSEQARVGGKFGESALTQVSPPPDRWALSLRSLLTHLSSPSLSLCRSRRSSSDRRAPPSSRSRTFSSSTREWST